MLKLKKNSFVTLDLMINMPPMEELWKMYGPIIEKEKKKKKDTLTKVK